VRVEVFRAAAPYLDRLGELGLDLDVAYRPELLACEADETGGTWEVLVADGAEGAFVYPYVLVPLPAPWADRVDLVSPYGYAGPFATSDAAMAHGETALLARCRELAPVTEFVRYHFAYNATRRFSTRITNLQNRRVVTVDLREDPARIRSSATHRNLVGRLRREGYAVEWEDPIESIDEFVAMYHATMRNAGASSAYFFGAGYFRRLAERMRGRVALGRVRRDGVTFAAGLFLQSGGIASYHLSARNLEHPKVPATNLLLAGAIERARDAGARVMNLGGGRTNDPEDALFKFKRHFSDQIVDYWIGKRVHDPEKYASVAAEWTARGGDPAAAEGPVLQFYR
jgi:hypothetical protein